MNKRPDGKAGFLHAFIARPGFASFLASRLVGITALAFVASVVTAPQTYAQSNAEGYIYGTAPSATSVVIKNLGTGLTRKADVKADGSYTVSSLPTGVYKVTAMKDATELESRDDVDVGVGVGSAVRFGEGNQTLQLDKMVVSNSTFPAIDTSRTGVSLSIRKETIDVLPVARNLAAVMLLAPSVGKGDAAFGITPSFAGASVAENNYFVNGFNITDLRKGLNFTRVPFDFQQSFEVKVGGYGVEYGRSTGGVTNTTTKSGTNKLEAGVAVYYEPDALNSNSPDVFQSDGTILNANSVAKSKTLTSEVYAGFPIIKNHVFFYGLYEARDIKNEYAGSNATTYYKASGTDPFWGGKLDYQINDNHRLEYTAISDGRKTDTENFAYDWATKKVGASGGLQYGFAGGRTDIYRYSGTFSDYFRGSVLYGKAKYNQTSSGTGDALPLIIDFRNSTTVYLNNANRSLIESGNDTRKAYRADGVLTLKGHNIKFGYEVEDNLSNDLTSYSGGVYWRYVKVPASGNVNGVSAGGAPEYVRKRVYQVGGAFKIKNTASYIEDSFRLLNDKLLINAGLRSESFKNYNKDEKIFVEEKNQYAPRVSLSYDPTGVGKAKLFANWGKYFLPIPSNTNIRGSGGEYYVEDYYVLTGLNADKTPILGTKLGNQVVNSSGIAPDPTTVAAIGLKPMFQTEWIVGGQMELAKHWTLTVQGMVRNLGVAIDDVEINEAIGRWSVRTGKPVFSPSADYVLINPGDPVTFRADTDGNGSLEPVTLSAADLGMPSPVRKYYALQFILEHEFSDKWYLNASYTWSQNYGNFEGWVKSDNEQADPGISAAYDYAEFTVNTYGPLPNDRRHVFKAYGLYRLTDELTIGTNMIIQSGRPIAKTGQGPSVIGVSGYSGAYNLAPRGSLGNNPWNATFDLSFTYKPKFFHEKATFALDVFNVLDSHTVVKRYELFEDANKTPSLTYGRAQNYQTPRYVRVSAAYSY